jgi:methylmalonyl-CoA mutase
MTEAKSEFSLAAEFPAVTQKEWRELINAALKGAPFDKRLVSHTYDGLRLEPLYARSTKAQSVFGREPGKAWTVMQRIDHPDPKAANEQILEDLKNGATGLTLVFAGSLNANSYGLDASLETLTQVLDGVELDAGITIDFNLSPPTRSAVQLFANVVKQRQISPAKVDLRASLNPIGGFAATGTTPSPWGELSKNLAASINDLAEQGYRGPFAVADGRIIHNAGGSEVQELAFALSAAIDCLRALEAGGISLEVARSMIYFRLAADADQFLTIAKFRAIRKLWARVEDSCGLTPKPITVAAETAWRMMTKRDAHVNMLRNTIAIAAAGLGGADNISVLPHTAALGLPDAFSRRIARNTQLILLEEANLAKVADPAAGSGAIEDLTAKLCAAAWTKFQELEQAGGAWASLEKGIIQRDVNAIHEKRRAAVAYRKDVITGTSDYPQLNEETVGILDIAPVAKTKEIDAVASIEPLPSIRLAEPFEKLRDKSDAIFAQTGKRPKVFLAALGKLPDFTVRVTFAKNFYEAGGIEAVINDGDSGDASAALHTDLAAVADTYRKSGAKLACLCSTDEIYKNEAAEAIKALTEAGAIVHLTGKPGENEQNWRHAGVKAFIFSGCDALSILRGAYDSFI